MCGLVHAFNVGDCQNRLVLLGELRPVDDFRNTGYYARRIQVVVESLALPEELREEQQVETLYPLGCIPHVERAAVAHRNRRFDYHHRLRIY